MNEGAVENEVARTTEHDSEVTVDERAALISAELIPVAVFLGWSWSEVRPDREILRDAA
jgi:hypothetical protein